jgi:hypothetical protein
MPFHLYKVWNDCEEPRTVGVRISYDDDHWVSVCREVDAEGEEVGESGPLTPTLYGVTAEQALRRMLEILENTYDEVVPAGQEVPP